MGNLSRLHACLGFILVAGGIYAAGIVATVSTFNDDARDDAQLKIERENAIMDCDNAECRSIMIDYYDNKIGNNNSTSITLLCLFDVFGAIAYLIVASCWILSVRDSWER